MSDIEASAAGEAWPRWRVFPPIALGVIMATLDASVVNIALPTLQRTLHAGLSTVEWVSLAYSLTLTGLMLAAGRFADAHGRRTTYGQGLLLFTAASVLCGCAPNVEALIGLRVLQGMGAALVAANGSALLVQAFPLAERGRALGAFGAMVGIGLAIGPPLGGLLVAHASWRWIFFINLPLGLLAWSLLQKRVAPDVAPAHPAEDRRRAAAAVGHGPRRAHAGADARPRERLDGSVGARRARRSACCCWVRSSRCSQDRKIHCCRSTSCSARSAPPCR